MQNEGEDVKEVSCNGNHGAALDKPEWGNGKFGAALSLDEKGNVVQIVQFGNAAPTKEVTITVWVLVKGVKNQDLLSFGPIIGNNRITIHLPWNNTVIWQHGPDQHAAWDHFPQEVVGQWAHWAFIGSAKKNFLKILRDGELFTIREEEPTAKAAFRASDQTWSIAGRKGVSYAGAIDEVALFNVALDDEDIRRIMDEGLEVAVFGAAVSPLGKLATTWSRI